MTTAVIFQSDTLLGVALLALSFCGLGLSFVMWRLAGLWLELERRRAELERCRWGINEHGLD